MSNDALKKIKSDEAFVRAFVKKVKAGEVWGKAGERPLSDIEKHLLLQALAERNKGGDA